MVTKKKVIQVAGNPLYAKPPTQSTPILNPATGLPQFGVFPAINTRDADFGGGPIYLRYGKHYETGRGYGFEHIWRARFPSCVLRSDAEPLVTALVASILSTGATIHYEGGLGSAERRTSIFRSRAGVLVVEERQDGSGAIFYGIVTAFKTAKVNGPVIGAI